MPTEKLAKAGVGKEEEGNLLTSLFRFCASCFSFAASLDARLQPPQSEALAW